MLISTKPLALYTFELCGRDAFREWIQTVQGTSAAKRIACRISRVRKGIVGDVKSFRLKNKIENPVLLELRLNFHNGYRIYAARCEDGLVLLAGGSKHRQREDVKQASRLCQAFASRQGDVKRFSLAEA